MADSRSCDASLRSLYVLFLQALLYHWYRSLYALFLQALLYHWIGLCTFCFFRLCCMLVSVSVCPVSGSVYHWHRSLHALFLVLCCITARSLYVLFLRLCYTGIGLARSIQALLYHWHLSHHVLLLQAHVSLASVSVRSVSSSGSAVSLAPSLEHSISSDST